MQLRPTVNPRRKPRLDKPKEEKTKGFSIEDIRNVILGKDANEQDKKPDYGIWKTERTISTIGGAWTDTKSIGWDETRTIKEGSMTDLVEQTRQYLNEMPDDGEQEITQRRMTNRN